MSPVGEPITHDMAFFRTSDDSDSPEATARRERFQQLAELVRLGVRQFEKIGRALEEIRDKQLYRDSFATFEECCRTEWNMSPQHAARLIDAASICREISPAGLQPNSERQIRPLAVLPPGERKAAWEEAAANGATAAAITAAVEKRRPATARKTRRTLRPVRIRVRGATVVIEPNKAFTTQEETLRLAIAKIEPVKRAQAA